MSVALFFEIEPIPEGSPQYIVFPVPGGAAVISRVTNGGRKGQNQWGPGVLPPASCVLTREPSALVVSPVDEAQFAARGVPTNLATKALAAHDKAPLASLTVADLGDVVEDVALSNSTLDQWVRDARRRHSVTQTAAKVIQPAPYVQVNVPAVPSAPVVSPTATAHNTSSKVCFTPDIEVAKRYVHRTVRGVDDFAVFDHAASTGQPVALYGPTGSAKTTAALAWAAQHRRKVAMVSGSVTLEPSQIFGQWGLDEVNGGFRWQDGIVTEVVRDGGVIVLDEINFIPGKIATVLFPLLQSGTRHLTLLDHNGETIKAHPDLVIFATWNPRYAGTLDLNAALRNRFAIQIEWGYDDEVEKRLVRSKAVRELARRLRDAEGREEIYTPTPTNALVEFTALTAALGIDFAVGNFLDRYEDDEKGKIRVVLEAVRSEIETDLGVAPAPVVDVAEATDVSDSDALRTLADLSL